MGGCLVASSRLISSCEAPCVKRRSLGTACALAVALYSIVFIRLPLEWAYVNRIEADAIVVEAGPEIDGFLAMPPGNPAYTICKNKFMRSEKHAIRVLLCWKYFQAMDFFSDSAGLDFHP